MLLENVSKKEFATVFTTNYGAIVKDFIQDDHDHAFREDVDKIRKVLFKNIYKDIISSGVYNFHFAKI